MFSRKLLFILTSIFESGAALLLFFLPDVALWLLIGVEEPQTETIIVERIAGTGLLAIGVACWFAHDDYGSSAQHAVLWGVLAYNAGAFIVLFIAGAIMKMSGFLLWPAVVLHGIMALWCVKNATRRT